jgi:hypothetical protein
VILKLGSLVVGKSVEDVEFGYVRTVRIWLYILKDAPLVADITLRQVLSEFLNNQFQYFKRILNE